MSKNLSAKYYQENKERLQKKAHERYQNLSKEKKTKKSDNMVVSVTKICHKIKNKSLLGIEKTYYRMKKKKHFIIIIKQIVLKYNDLESSFNEEIKNFINIKALFQ